MRELKVAIILTGKISSGKSTVGNIILEKFGIPMTSFGKYLKNYCEINGIEPNRKNLQDLGEKFIIQDYKRFLNEVVNFTSQSSPYIIFDGVRHNTILDEIVLNSKSAIMIFVDADIKTRYDRYFTRNKQSDQLKSFNEFLDSDNHPVEKEIELLKGKSDLIIDSGKISKEEIEKTVIGFISALNLNFIKG